MQNWITQHLPLIISILACVGLLMVSVVVGLLLLHYAINAYNKVLRVWSPKGWYYSACLAISDMARGKPWHIMHLNRVASLLLGLKEQNPSWFAQLMEAVNTPQPRQGVTPKAPINGASSSKQSEKPVARR